MLESFTTVTANRSTVLPCSALRSSVSPANGVHTLFAVNLCGRGQFAIDLLAHLGFKRMVSCSFSDKRMRLKTRAYGIMCKKRGLGGYCYNSIIFFGKIGASEH